MCAKKVPLRHRLRNTDGEALMQVLEDSGKTVEKINLSATSFFRRDPRYGPKHYDTRIKFYHQHKVRKTAKILNSMQTK